MGRGGRISLATYAYPIGNWLSGETVDVVIPYGRLLEIFHLAVLIAAYAQRHDPRKKTTIICTTRWPSKKRKGRMRSRRFSLTNRPSFPSGKRNGGSGIHT